jgi:hypothetical protein
MGNPRQRKMDLRFGLWNFMGVYRAGSLKTLASQLAKYNLDLVAVRKVRYVEGGSQPEENYTFFCGNVNRLFRTQGNQIRSQEGRST